VKAMRSDGTFYSFPDMSQIIENRNDIDNDVELAELLLERAAVAVVPGSAFGAPGCMRVSYATSMAILEQALGQIAAVLNS